MHLPLPDQTALWTEEGREDRAAQITFARNNDALRVQITADSKPLALAALRWELPVPEGVRVRDHWERGYGDLEWRGLVPERVLPWYCALHSPAAGETYGYGVATGANALASWRVDQSGLTLLLDIRSGGKGVTLNGRTLEAATVHFRPPGSETPLEAVRGLCALLCASPRLPGFPVYGANDWYYIYGENTARTVRRDAALVRELSLNRENAPFMVIDAGWFPERGCNGGPYTHGNRHFPDMPGLAAELKTMEVRPGIWIRPLLTTEAVPESWRLPRNHPVYATGEKGIFLDPSIPEVLERVREDIARCVAWGYELVKHDFTTFDLTGRWGFQMLGGGMTPSGWSFADPTRTTAEIINGLYSAIRQGAGEALLLGCNTVGHLGAGVFEVQRTGDDTSGREWERTRKMGVNTLAFRMPQHGTFFAADADCVGLTDRIPWEKNRQWLDLLARSGTPLFVSADPEALGPEQRQALRDAFARAALPQPPAEPQDWLETTCPRLWRFADGGMGTYNWVSDLYSGL